MDSSFNMESLGSFGAPVSGLFQKRSGGQKHGMDTLLDLDLDMDMSDSFAPTSVRGSQELKPQQGKGKLLWGSGNDDLRQAKASDVADSSFETPRVYRQFPTSTQAATSASLARGPNTPLSNDADTTIEMEAGDADILTSTDSEYKDDVGGDEEEEDEDEDDNDEDDAEDTTVISLAPSKPVVVPTNVPPPDQPPERTSNIAQPQLPAPPPQVPEAAAHETSELQPVVVHCIYASR